MINKNTDFNTPNNTLSLLPVKTAENSEVLGPYSGGTKNVLKNEREKASFETEAMSVLLYGSEQLFRRRRFIMKPLQGKGAAHKFENDRSTLMSEGLQHFLEIHGPYYKSFSPTREDIGLMYTIAIQKNMMSNHFNLFLSTLRSQASDEQKAEWLERAMALKIVGSYAQTELGHGSNIRGLTTTAHLVWEDERKGFVLNSQDLLSLKFWPGALGKVANFAIVYAQLIVNQKEHGLHAFMVQIRDENHRPLPGLELGDLGPKMGDHANDTGFMRIQNVFLPIKNMLARYQKIDENGHYVKSPQKMIDRAFGALAKAALIATRYSCIRKQGYVAEGFGAYRAPEVTLIDHPVQRYRIVKQICLAYGIRFIAKSMFGKLLAIEKKFGEVDDTADELSTIAPLSAGLKAFCTISADRAIEDLRKCCGGNGFLMNSGLPGLAADFVWQTTAEGDFVVLLLNAAKFLVKTTKEAKSRAVSPKICNFLLPFDRKAPTAQCADDFNSLPFLVSVFAYQALLQCKQCVSHGDQIWKVQLNDMVKSFCQWFILSTFLEEIENIQNRALKPVLCAVSTCLAQTMLIDANAFGLFGALDSDANQHLRDFCRRSLETLRPDCLALVEAFDFPDEVLNSTIGSSDGAVYERLYEAAKKSRLNNIDPFDGYAQLRPLLDVEYLKQNKQSQSTLGMAPSKL